MSFDWGHYLGLAEALYTRCGDIGERDACLRSSISRGYYAVFCLARDVAKSRLGLVVAGSADDHASVRNHYLHSTDKSLRTVGSVLDRLRDRRNDADYEATVGDLGYMAQHSLDEAKRAYSILRAI